MNKILAIIFLFAILSNDFVKIFAIESFPNTYKTENNNDTEMVENKDPNFLGIINLFIFIHIF